MIISYKKNKNFLPEEFYYKKIEHTRKILSKYLYVLLVINLIMMPMSVKCIRSFLIENTKKNTEYKENNITGYSSEDIKKWVDCLEHDEVKEADITQDGASIKISSLNNFYKSDLKNRLEITYVKNENDYCIAGVEIHE